MLVKMLSSIDAGLLAIKLALMYLKRLRYIIKKKAIFEQNQVDKF